MNPKVRSFALPVAIVVGALFNGFFADWSFLSPYLIFAMLYITFSRVSLSEMRVGWFHFVLLLFQIGLGSVLYFLLRGTDEVVAQGAMICVFAPAAMARTWPTAARWTWVRLSVSSPLSPSVSPVPS